MADHNMKDENFDEIPEDVWMVGNFEEANDVSMRSDSAAANGGSEEDVKPPLLLVEKTKEKSKGKEPEVGVDQSWIAEELKRTKEQLRRTEEELASATLRIGSITAVYTSYQECNTNLQEYNQNLVKDCEGYLSKINDLQTELKKTRRELDEAKKELQEERDNVRNHTLNRGRTMRKLDDALRAVAAAETRAAVAESRCSDFEVKLKSSQNKMNDLVSLQESFDKISKQFKDLINKLRENPVIEGENPTVNNLASDVQNEDEDNNLASMQEKVDCNKNDVVTPVRDELEPPQDGNAFESSDEDSLYTKAVCHTLSMEYVTISKLERKLDGEANRTLLRTLIHKMIVDGYIDRKFTSRLGWRVRLTEINEEMNNTSNCFTAGNNNREDMTSRPSSGCCSRRSICAQMTCMCRMSGAKCGQSCECEKGKCSNRE